MTYACVHMENILNGVCFFAVQIAHKIITFSTIKLMFSFYTCVFISLQLLSWQPDESLRRSYSTLSVGSTRSSVTSENPSILPPEVRGGEGEQQETRVKKMKKLWGKEKKDRVYRRGCMSV